MATSDDGRKPSPDVTAPTLLEGPGRSGAAVDGAADTAAATPADMLAATSQPSARFTGPIDEQMVGSVLEQRYEITRKIGQGGMGAVFEATHKLIGKRVAVKVLLDKYADKDSLVARLEQEARLASSIGHPNIIDITDFGTTVDGRTFVVMEYLEGDSLGAVISREGKLDTTRATRIGRQIASALDAAHKKGVVHRDLKPENVFLVARGDGDFVKVVDFGISKLLRNDPTSDTPRLTQTGMVLGTPLYMSPEQARGDESLDHRIDVYALGVILFEMVTGEVPFRGTNYLNILSQVISEEPPAPRGKNPAVSVELEAVILKALEKDPAHRYQSMAEIGDDLAAMLATDGSLASTSARVSAMRRRRPGQRRGPLVPVLLALAVLGAGGLAMKLVADQDGAAPRAAVAPSEPRPTPTPVETVSTPTPTPAPVETVTFTIISEPKGATVYEGDARVGLAPQTRTLVKRDKQVVFYLEKGPLSGQIDVNPIELVDGREITVRLTKGKLQRPRPTQPGGTPTSTGPGGDRTDDTAGGDLTGDPND